MPNKAKWKPVFDILTSIKARNYSTLKPDDDWYESLEKAAKNFKRGVLDIEIEAEKFKTWLLSQIDCRARLRNARHRPRWAFLNWLRNAIKYRAQEKVRAEKKEIRYTPPRDCEDGPELLGDILKKAGDHATD